MGSAERDDYHLPALAVLLALLQVGDTIRDTDAAGTGRKVERRTRVQLWADDRPGKTVAGPGRRRLTRMRTLRAL